MSNVARLPVRNRRELERLSAEHVLTVSLSKMRMRLNNPAALVPTDRTLLLSWLDDAIDSAEALGIKS